MGLATIKKAALKIQCGCVLAFANVNFVKLP
ncbi:hypothetical protein B0F87_101702 [Methylobacter tundripaludum]|uniref:Uncharacterized protein n=1 Tax=Methylobacter tundripaludum TaxID=173365 RepID=A0A2S6HLE1_9GAMM|nr:hypothetical protein B0F87_101702 [Methylobacter tundripaludum]